MFIYINTINQFMHIAFTYTVRSAACAALVACGVLIFAGAAHAQVTQEESEALQAQLQTAQEMVDGLSKSQGKVLGLNTVALSGSGASFSSSGDLSNIFKQLESLQLRVKSFNTNSSGSGQSGKSYASDLTQSLFKQSDNQRGHNISNTAKKTALEKQIQEISKRIDELTKQKAKLQAELDQIGADPISTKNPKNSTGIVVTQKSSTAVKEGDTGVFTLEFEVRAKEGDVYINESAVRHATFDRTAGVNYVIKKKADKNTQNSRSLSVVDLSQSAITTGTVEAELSSDAEQSGDYYIVEKGESELFTLEVEYTPAASGSYQLQVLGVNWNTSASDAAKRTTPRSGKGLTTDLLKI